MRALILCLALAWTAAAPAADAPGSKDHPMITRYEGAEIAKYETRTFDRFDFVSAPIAKYSHDALADSPGSFTRVEGAYTRIAYKAPAGRTAIEMFRNYEQALAAGGFQTVFTCAGSSCDVKDRGRAFNLAVRPPYMSEKFGFHEQQNYLLARLPRAEGDVWVALLVAEPPAGPDKGRGFADLQVVETQPMQTGMVRVDAAAMARGLDAEGHIALYEVYFDTGKADLKPESDAALAEIATLLKDNAALKVLVVGHTDNAGELAYNQALSERRAKSVVEALAGRHGIARERLTPVGVGMAAPVASNDSEGGRAKNRRVELVKR